MKIKEPIKKYHVVSSYELEEDTYETTLQHSDDLEELTAAAKDSFALGRRDPSYIVQLVRVVKAAPVDVVTEVEDIV